jgi:hypothetical protein
MQAGTVGSDGSRLSEKEISSRASSIGDQVTASVEIVGIREDKPIATLRTICVDNEGEVLVEGEAVVKFT